MDTQTNLELLQIQWLVRVCSADCPSPIGISCVAFGEDFLKCRSTHPMMTRCQIAFGVQKLGRQSSRFRPRACSHCPAALQESAVKIRLPGVTTGTAPEDVRRCPCRKSQAGWWKSHDTYIYIYIHIYIYTYIYYIIYTYIERERESGDENIIIYNSPAVRLGVLMVVPIYVINGRGGMCIQCCRIYFPWTVFMQLHPKVTAWQVDHASVSTCKSLEKNQLQVSNYLRYLPWSASTHVAIVHVDDKRQLPHCNLGET